MIFSRKITGRATTARSGFSLMELMIAIAVLGLILAVAGPALMRQYRSAQKKTAMTSIKLLKSTIEMFELDVGKLPEKLRDLVKRPSPGGYYNSEEISNWQDGGYLKTKKVPVDPWKNKFRYRLIPDGRRYELYSYGPNGKGSPKSEWIRTK